MATPAEKSWKVYKESITDNCRIYYNHRKLINSVQIKPHVYSRARCMKTD